MKRLLVLLLLAPLLAGCVTDGGGSVTGGECKVFERPPYAVRGATQYDQDVADDFVESGVGGCHWQRPAPRPAAMDAPKPVNAVAKPVKKRTLIQRVKAKVWPRAGLAPFVSAPAPLPAAVAEPAPPPAPRSAIDELLFPDGVK